MLRRGVIFFMLLLIFLSPWAEAGEQGYLQKLLKEAEEKALHRDRYWHVLLHYKKTFFGIESLIDDPKFFVSPAGKKDPESELLETIKSFFKEYNDEGSDTRCRFPARYKWLKERLAIDETMLPGSGCSELEKFLEALNPQSATLVFPSAYMNSPASMFGHTLIRIDGKYQSKLISYAINYAANTGDEGGISYLIKGLFGFFKGYFSILPYYEKIEEYNDLDMRDMWEYELNLSEDEVMRMVLHIWELKDIYSFYYFFDENCSYNLLFLIEAARPEVNLTDEFGQWVVPSDTLKAVIGKGLVKAVTYRPSRSTRIRHWATFLSPKDKKLAADIASGVVSPNRVMDESLERQGKIIVLDIAAELVQHRFMRRDIDKEIYQKRFLEILNVRKDLGKQDSEILNIPQPPRPEEGHSSSMVNIGVGTKDNKAYQLTGFRPAYHDLADREHGFQKGSEIIFGSIELRYYPDDKKALLNRVDIIDIVSLSIRDEFFKPVSWKVYAGFRRETLYDGREHLIYSLNPGFGFASKGFAGIYYAFVEADLQIGRGFGHDYTFGVGPSAGIIKDFTKWWKILLSSRFMYHAMGDSNRLYALEMKHNFSITKDHALRLNFIRTKSYSQYSTDINLLWNIYF